DSQILKFTSQLLGRPIREKISGSDLLPAYIHHYRNDPEVKLFLLGAAEGVADAVRHHINQLYGREMVVDVYSPSYGFEADDIECQQIINRINRSQATTLVVGLGAPKQEIWIHKNRRKLKTVSTFLAIGAGLDFLAGNQQRSPKWMSNAGLEWLYRLLSEPQRLWKRYLVESLPFFWLLPQQALNFYQPPHFGATDVEGWDGERAVLAMMRAGLLTEEQLNVARSQQQDYPHLTLAEIVSVRGWLTKQTVNFFIERLPSLQHDMRQQPLGDYLVAAGLIDSTQLAVLLLERQSDAHRREEQQCIGGLAVQHGWLTRQTVDFFLTEVAPECESLPYEIFDRPSVTEVAELQRFTPPSPGMEQAAT
ncbi:MAG: WecB/TagA/CpsF family glycosyltransferase, partial [Cyanobacteria bacterium P01_E01_bin.34]